VPLHQGVARSNDHAAGLGLDSSDIERLIRGDSEAPPLPDGESANASVTTQHRAVDVNDIARLERVRA